MDKQITVETIIKICKGKLISGDSKIIIDNYCLDSRKVKKNDFYISIKGDNTDGNLYLEEALKQDAIGCLINTIPNIDIIKKYSNKVIIQVQDSIEAIQELAKYKRSLYNIPIVAVTGSVGKTSTKDIIASVLEQEFKVLKTEGNYNNHIGLPMTILKLKDHTAAVIEMGMNHFGEISKLTNIVKPTVAVITNIGTSHIGNLGSRENILQAKLEILEGLNESGITIINNDNDLLNKWHKENTETNTITYGIHNTSTYMPSNILLDNNKTEYDIILDETDYKVTVPVIGEHFIYNSLCALAVGKALNMKAKNIIKGISNFKLTSKRMEFIKIKNNITILKDCYNASYDSIKSALEVVNKYNAKRKIAVLGDMLELGKFSKQLHRSVGEEVYKNKVDILITVGELAKDIAQKAEELGTKNIFVCNNNEEAVEILKSNIKEEDLILLKASNRMNFEQIFKEISI